MEKMYINFFMLQQFSFLLSKETNQTVYAFHLRLCHLLEGPKRPIRTEGTVPKFQGKIPYRGVSSNLDNYGAPGGAPYPSGTQSQNDVIMTSMRPDDIMCLQGRAYPS